MFCVNLKPNDLDGELHAQPTPAADAYEHLLLSREGAEQTHIVQWRNAKTAP